jgi:hypothetical protein
MYEAVLSAIKKAFPKKTDMVNSLADILMIEKGAVYRRLRQEVPFTFNEIATIAKRLNISLDDTLGIDGHKSIPFQLQLPDFISPKEEDYYVLDLYLKFLQSLHQSGISETASINNHLPLGLFSSFHHIFTFYLFKWNFHYNNDKIKPFHQVSTSEKMTKFLAEEYTIEMKRFSKTYYVLDNRVFRDIVSDILYFNSIRLIEKDDVLKIKEDLMAMLDYLEKMAITGQFKETGNLVNLYISDIEIASNYSYMESDAIHFSLLKVFILSSVTSFDEDTFMKMKKWIHSLIKISTLITLTNERQRVLYFERQRKIVSEL